MRSVLVPLDGSSRSEAALRKAFDLFPEAEIHVLHVLQVTEFQHHETMSAYELAVEDCEEIIDDAERLASDHGREIETEVIEGNAAKTILRYAEENDIDHVVMGSTGRSGLSRVLLGSVAEAVTRRAPCSVTIVREA
ncbi:universal stress protein [Natronomonas sp.]|uniref:universal stress protein n=1 Tax=Natronomonas sp. TaxID=2184060 RepID=UPI002FC3AA91